MLCTTTLLATIGDLDLFILRSRRPREEGLWPRFASATRARTACRASKPVAASRSTSMPRPKWKAFPIDIEQFWAHDERVSRVR